TQIGDVQQHLSGNPSDGEIPRNTILMRTGNLCAAASEPDLRKVLHIEEIRALQMSVAVRFACPQLTGIDLHFDRSGRRGGGVKRQRTVYVFEMAAYPRHHHMPATKPGGRMSRFKFPSHGLMHP